MTLLSASHFELPFFTNLLILLVTSRFFGELFERMKQPSMIGEIIAGIILGPSLFNLIHRTEDIKVISELGIFLLVIIAGLEINIDDILRSMKGRNIIISFMAFFLPILCGISVGYFFEQDIMTTVFIGLCVAITALPVSIRILMDLGKINSEAGQKIISVAIFDDVLALTMLGVLLNIKNTDMSFSTIASAIGFSLLKLIIFIVLLSAAYLFIRKTTDKGNYIEESLNNIVDILKGKESLFAIFFAFVLLFATFTESLGLHFIVGAFFASLLISESLIGKKNIKAIDKTTRNISIGFLTPIFFAGIGLEFNFNSIANFGLFLAIIVVSYLSKILGGFTGGLLAGLKRDVSLTIGIGLNARGIMELVIANIAYQAGLINTEVFSILVLMGILTTLTTPLLLKQAFSRSDKKVT
ncbi:MAG: cation:proton antiporter [Saprospiraceae bacterium]